MYHSCSHLLHTTMLDDFAVVDEISEDLAEQSCSKETTQQTKSQLMKN